MSPRIPPAPVAATTGTRTSECRCSHEPTPRPAASHGRARERSQPRDPCRRSHAHARVRGSHFPLPSRVASGRPNCLCALAAHPCMQSTIQSYFFFRFRHHPTPLPCHLHCWCLPQQYRHLLRVSLCPLLHLPQEATAIDVAHKTRLNNKEILHRRLMTVERHDIWSSPAAPSTYRARSRLSPWAAEYFCFDLPSRLPFWSSQHVPSGSSGTLDRVLLSLHVHELRRPRTAERRWSDERQATASGVILSRVPSNSVHLNKKAHVSYLRSVAHP